jgi:hypothetical protein
MAESILRQGITQNAQPHENLQRSLIELDNGHDESTQLPSMSLTTITAETEIDLPFLLGRLGSDNVHGILDSMEFFIRQRGAISLFDESDHYNIPLEQLRAQSSMGNI